jgi:hypothetical protein
MFAWRPILGVISRLNHSNTILANAQEWCLSEIGKIIERIDSKNLELNYFLHLQVNIFIDT